MSDHTITCSDHGETAATFTCLHLADRDAADRGVFFDRTSDEPWPDMICTDCSEEPEWSDDEARKRIRVLCSDCWEDAFGRNTPTRHATPERWLTDTAHRAEIRQRRWSKDNGIVDAKRYRYELDERPPWLGFGASDEKFDILCEPIVIGSWSKTAGTWLWGWANSWWATDLTRPIVRVKRAGERLGVERLWRSSFETDEPACWELCLATLELLPEYSGVYRSPDDEGALFLLTRNTRRVT